MDIVTLILTILEGMITPGRQYFSSAGRLMSQGTNFETDKNPLDSYKLESLAVATRRAASTLLGLGK